MTKDNAAHSRHKLCPCGRMAKLSRCWCNAQLCDDCRLGYRHAHCLERYFDLRLAESLAAGPVKSGKRGRPRKNLPLYSGRGEKPKIDRPLTEFMASVQDIP